ncbi:ER lumen protein-retaining receptor A-like [Lactuca sativa]|uniref:ER lumen protein-retaining receptor A-like n=1 Tax=Lactuca sativa TaxID=4236 RepID=UPI0022AF6CED|nr:ER lumen protein-retaining receptor A-like [Lactuca sativa]
MYACHIKLYFAILGLLAPTVIKQKACSGWFSFMKTGCVALVLCLNISVDPPNICWAFSIYLEAVAILPQLVLLQRSGNVDNLIGQYVFFLGAYRALNILNWIFWYLTQPHFNGWISCFSGLIQTALYADFFYYYFIRYSTSIPILSVLSFTLSIIIITQAL